MSFLNDGSVPDTIKTLCNIDEVNEGGDEVVCNTQSALSMVCDIEEKYEGRGGEPMANTQEALEMVCEMEDERGGVSDSESEPMANTQQALEMVCDMEDKRGGGGGGGEGGGGVSYSDDVL